MLRGKKYASFEILCRSSGGSLRKRVKRGSSPWESMLTALKSEAVGSSVGWAPRGALLLEMAAIVGGMTRFSRVDSSMTGQYQFQNMR
jgi:hypothetical protein